jgi:serine/threonine-protein kinase
MAGADATQPRSTNQPQTVFSVGDLVGGNYQILAHAGSGGMGVVYRARDVKLERTVALKFLPSEVNASDREKRRFRTEARLAAALDHPNIGAIHGIDTTDDGRTFIIMAFYEGPSLANRIRSNIPLKLAEIIDIAKQVARGLTAAHAQNIIHRDIKPSNVMFAGSGLVKIVDFGLAHVSDETATLTHGAAGTLGYMAPEHALNRGVDQRADIWALGVVLAEMLTGHNPFQRDSLPATLLAVLNEPPTSLEGVPLELQRIVYHALAKDRLKRYQSCSELLHDLDQAEAVLKQSPDSVNGPSSKPSKSRADLRRSPEAASRPAMSPPVARSRGLSFSGIAALGLLLIAAGVGIWFGPGRAWLRDRHQRKTTATIPQPTVLALLPFAPVAADARLNALGQGLIESVGAKLSSLAENRPFEVISTRNLQEKGVTALSDARRQFGANLGLSVNLQLAGNRVKVSYQLLEAKSGSALAGNSITVPGTDVFAVEANVVQGVVDALQLKLQPEEETALRVHGTNTPAAYNYYLLAGGYLVDYTKLDNVENAIRMNLEALKLDPAFGAAKASLGETYWRKYALTKDKTLTEQAKGACQSAVTLGNAGAAGHICLGLVAGGTGQYRESAQQFQLAVELEPTNESAIIGLASALEHEGAVNEAEAAYQRGIDSHPQSYFAYNAMGGFYYRRSDYEKAIHMFQRVTELAPENYAGYVNLGGTYNDLGRFLEAIEPLKTSIVLRPSYGGYTNLGTSYLGLHKLNEAADAYQQAVKLDPRQYVTWGNLAAAQYYSGAKEKGLDSYRRAAELASEELKVNSRDVDVLSDLAQYYAMVGHKEQALECLRQALQYGHSEKELLASAAQVYNQLGETGLALEWMNKAIQAGYSARKFQDLPAFRNLVDNPRYQDIVGRGQHRQ